MNNERDFSLGKLLFKIIMVIAFVFLLMWLFPMPNLNPVYDRIFADNIETMKDSAKSYYTVERLPIKVNDSVKLTLDEMLSMKLLLPIADSDSKLCDGQASYVQITKTETEYIIKTNLSCPNKTDYVIEHMGCYDLCNDSCTVKVEEPVKEPIKVKPQVTKYTTIYKLTRNWYKGSITYTGEATTQYKHVKYVDESYISGYSCSTGTLTSDNICKSSSTVYTCANGATPTSDNTCPVVTNNTTYTCANGVTPTSDNTCPVVTNSTTYTCPDDSYSASGSGASMTCSKQIQTGTTTTTDYISTVTSKYGLVSNSTYKYVSTGSAWYKDCSACASYIMYTYKKYKYVYTPIYGIVTAAPKSNTNTRTTYIAATATGTTTTSYIGAVSNTKITYRDATAIYKTRQVISDTKWTFNYYEIGYVMVDMKTIPGGTSTIYTDWVLTLPSGYTKTDTKAEYKWASSKISNGWIYTGESKRVVK